jgi:hypothetical protein
MEGLSFPAMMEEDTEAVAHQDSICAWDNPAFAFAIVTHILFGIAFTTITSSMS